MPIYIIGGIFLILAFALAVFAIWTNYLYRKKLEELTEYQINVSANIDSSIPEILDLIIQESFTDYQIKFLAHRELGYINEEEEIKIREGLINVISLRISDASLDKLSLFYNKKNIADILADKIYIAVMNYVIEHNKSIEV